MKYLKILIVPLVLTTAILITAGADQNNEHRPMMMTSCLTLKFYEHQIIVYKSGQEGQEIGHANYEWIIDSKTNLKRINFTGIYIHEHERNKGYEEIFLKKLEPLRAISL